MLCYFSGVSCLLRPLFILGEFVFSSPWKATFFNCLLFFYNLLATFRLNAFFSENKIQPRYIILPRKRKLLRLRNTTIVRLSSTNRVMSNNIFFLYAVNQLLWEKSNKSYCPFSCTKFNLTYLIQPIMR